MKKIRSLLSIGCFCLTVTGCFDVMQHITRNSDGTDQNTIRITVSKAIIEMIAGMSSDKSSFDYNELLSEFKTSDIDEYEQFNAKVTKINDDVNIGCLIDMKIDYKDKKVIQAIEEDDIDFIPQYNKKMMSIYIESTQNNSFGPDDNMGMMLLANSKYRLLVSKSCMPSVSKVVITTDKNSTTTTYLDLYDEYLIEVPISLLLNDSITIEIYR